MLICRAFELGDAATGNIGAGAGASGPQFASLGAVEQLGNRSPIGSLGRSR
jgi:hypothetical protein